jgi:glycosyltransferase involved in cell wall biosynthesis
MKKKLAVLVNVIAPYRVPILASLAEEFDTLVLHGGNEPNREWKVDLPPALKTQKVFTIQIPLHKKIGIDGVIDTTYLHLNLGLMWWLMRFRPKVILSSEMGVRTMIALLYGMFARVPVWVWWGGTIHSERNISQARKLLRRILKLLITRWVSYGASTTEYLESIGISRKRILQIQNCVPHETFISAPAQPSAWFMANPRPVILTVGQLVQRKGLDKLIEACGRLSASGRDFSLVIVGQGPELESLYKLAKERGVRDFAILPNQSQSTLSEIYRNSDVFVFPTLEDVWGLVVNEALWAGTPVLCSKYAGCAAELIPETNIFDPMSPESFDNALAKVFKRTVSPPDTSRLRTWQEVAAMMRGSLDAGTPAHTGTL